METSKVKLLNEILQNNDYEEVIFNIALLLISKSHINIENIKNIELKKFFSSKIKNNCIYDKIYKLECNIKDIEYIMECSQSNVSKKEKGIVYTPNYIIDLILDNTASIEKISKSKIIDPSCGCGAFMIRIIERVITQTNADVVDFISNNLFGIDIDMVSIERIKFLIQLCLLSNGYNIESIKINVLCSDSLNSNWMKMFNVDDFDFVVGNPPYVKIQNLSRDYYEFLKYNFSTTKSGGFNLFYAFIEKGIESLSPNGKLGFIVPNNFLKIKSGYNLRKYIKDGLLLNTIIDFNSNMIFSPIMTYNCILILDKAKGNTFKYASIEKTDSIELMTQKIEFITKNINDLNDNQWLLVDKEKIKKINQIERFNFKLGPFIRTGIATLRDKLYIIDSFSDSDATYLKYYKGESFVIEKEILKPLYKVSDIKNSDNITKDKKYIIFPYKKINGSIKPFEEEELKKVFPYAYNYLRKIKNELDERNNDKNSKYWYCYGRSQGINNYGLKLMYSQFLDSPKFIMNYDSESLFCNGFAIYVPLDYDLNILQKIIQSKIMDFYITNTSYSIDGGYKCYQKKYLQNFSIPPLNQEQIKYLKSENNQQNINIFLNNIYFT
jgi:tRNA1(Val) A37 N6-methylase TrmN6